MPFVEGPVGIGLQFVLLPFTEGIVFFSIDEDGTSCRFARLGHVVSSVLRRGSIMFGRRVVLVMYG